MQVSPTQNVTRLGLICSSSQLAATIGAIMQKAAAALPVSVAARTEAKIKPNITLVILPFDNTFTLCPIIFTNCVLLNPADTTNILSTIMTLLFPMFPNASFAEIHPVSKKSIILQAATVPNVILPQM